MSFVPSRPRAIVIVLGVCLASVAPRADAPLGYYRFPALSGDLLVFTAEGDLWKTTVNGGVPERLTAHPGQETDAAVSPDGKWVAFTGTYEGPEEAYVLPLEGGLPRRLTWDGGPVSVVAWTPDGKVLYLHAALLDVAQRDADRPRPGLRRAGRPCRWRRQATASTPPTARSFSRGCPSRAATRGATRAAPRSSCGDFARRRRRSRRR